LAVLVTPSVHAGAAVLKAVSGMDKVQAEAYRFARLHREISLAPKDWPLVGKLKAQIKASTQELMLKLHESKAGLRNGGMQRQSDRCAWTSVGTDRPGARRVRREIRQLRQTHAP
jgi:hypothetical protein